ncbi:unnamed protein product [Linum trigynum]|uniref:Uncharacterized protein n=1 Tax=Linum trigynum TaxID=586398 RepID=A0AAV2E9W3_9ROSI
MEDPSHAADPLCGPNSASSGTECALRDRGTLHDGLNARASPSGSSCGNNTSREVSSTSMVFDPMPCPTQCWRRVQSHAIELNHHANVAMPVLHHHEELVLHPWETLWLESLPLRTSLAASHSR